jgi:hypothetical protein
LNLQNFSHFFLFIPQFFFEFGQLHLHCIDTLVDSFLESVARFRDEKRVAGNGYGEADFLVHGRGGLYDFQLHFHLLYFVVGLFQLGYFLFHECLQFVGCVKLDGLNLDFHKYLLFFKGYYFIDCSLRLPFVGSFSGMGLGVNAF